MTPDFVYNVPFNFEIYKNPSAVLLPSDLAQWIIAQEYKNNIRNLATLLIDMPITYVDYMDIVCKRKR